MLVNVCVPFEIKNWSWWVLLMSANLYNLSLFQSSVVYRSSSSRASEQQMSTSSARNNPSGKWEGASICRRSVSSEQPGGFGACFHSSVWSSVTEGQSWIDWIILTVAVKEEIIREIFEKILPETYIEFSHQLSQQKRCEKWVNGLIYQENTILSCFLVNIGTNQRFQSINQ